MEILLITGCFLFVLFSVLCGGYWFLHAPVAAPQLEPKQAGVSLNEDDGPIRQTLERIGSILPSANDLHHPIRARLLAAGYREPDALQAFFGIKAVSAVVGFVVGLLVCRSFESPLMTGILTGVCGVGIGFLIPDRVLKWIEGKRKQRLRQALPAALDLLVLSLEAGQGLDSALIDTSSELKRIYPDLSEELTLAHLEARAGQSRADVLDRLAVRTREPEIRKLTNLLLDGDRFGTSLGPALRNHANHTRTRRRQAAQEQARKTGVKLVFPVFFLIFPCVLLVTLGPAVLRLMKGMNEMVR